MWFKFGAKHPFGLNILCILDQFSTEMFKQEPHVHLEHAQPGKFPRSSKKYDLLLVESAWLGNRRQWKYQIADYPDFPERNLDNITQLIIWAKSQHIPTVFWNKEDPFHFNQFLNTAQLFDYILTTDSSLVSTYEHMCPNSTIHAFSFPFQPKIHFPTSFDHIRSRSSVFIGSYMRHMHNARQKWQDMCFNAASSNGLSVYDRHAKKAKKMKDYQFPEISNIRYHPSVPYAKTAKYYHHYQQAINVNTVTDSPSMYSRRLIEIMACNRLAVSNPSTAIEQLFPDMCESINNTDEATALFERLQYGYTNAQVEKVEMARLHVFEHYTVQHWLRNLLNIMAPNHPFIELTV